MPRQAWFPIAGRIMRLTKKAAALLVAAAMVMSMGTTVFAEDGDGADAGTTESSTKTAQATTTVKYDVQESYIWTVPSTIDFTGVAADNSNQATVERVNNVDNKLDVTKNVINANKKLVISVASTNSPSATDGEFVIKTSEDATLKYKIYKKSSEENATYETDNVKSEVFSVPAGKTDYVYLKFVLTKDNANYEKAGNYSDTLTFTAKLDTVTTGGNSQQG